jgi:hypothetical protein
MGQHEFLLHGVFRSRISPEERCAPAGFTFSYLSNASYLLSFFSCILILFASGARWSQGFTPAKSDQRCFA